MSGNRARLGSTVAAMLALLRATAAAGDPAEAPRSSADRATFAIEYVVRISPERPSIARVRWNLAGIDEIRRFRIALDDGRFRDFHGSGEIERRDSEILWRPSGPYAHLEYAVGLRHRRAPGKGYDSYATKNWVLTRARDLFPRTRVTFELDVERDPRSRSTLRFLLPSGWKSYSAMEQLEPDLFRPLVSERRLDRPKGWIALGRLEKIEREIAGVDVAVVTPPGSVFPGKAVLDLYDQVLPTLVDLLSARIPRLLIVSAPDPMWRGGLSGERSFYLHAERPVRTRDVTSPALHEAFHVFAPFRAGADARWLSEGLAEYYSLTLQHRVGAISDAERRRGILLWRRYGEWGVNLTTGEDLAVTNNAAPFVLAAIDEWIREKTAAARSLDDVLRELAGSRDHHLTTASFLRTVKRIAGSDLTPFVQRHVYAGAVPQLRLLVDELDKGATASP